MKIKDKTLVAWVSLADPAQCGRHILTIDNGGKQYDALAYSEIAPRKWMSSSDMHRRSETDHTTGEVHLIIEDDFGKVQDADHGLITSSIARERWSIHPDDPLSARGTLHWSNELGRGDWSIRTETYSEMWSDAETFFLKARVEAYEGDALIYERDIKDQIPRDQM